MASQELRSESHPLGQKSSWWLSGHRICFVRNWPLKVLKAVVQKQFSFSKSSEEFYIVLAATEI